MPTNTEIIRQLEKTCTTLGERVDATKEESNRARGEFAALQKEVREATLLLARLDERVKTLEQNSTGRSARTWAVWTLLASALLSVGGGLLGAWLKNRFGIP